LTKCDGEGANFENATQSSELVIMQFTIGTQAHVLQVFNMYLITHSIQVGRLIITELYITSLQVANFQLSVLLIKKSRGMYGIPN